MGKLDLTKIELQKCVDTVNTVFQEERVCKAISFYTYGSLI